MEEIEPLSKKIIRREMGQNRKKTLTRGGGFQLETTFERTGIGAPKMDHAKEQNLLYNRLTFGSD